MTADVSPVPMGPAVRLAAPDEPPVTYRPGTWAAIVTDDLAVLADVPADSRRLAAVWTAAVGGQGQDAVLAALGAVTDYAAVSRTAEQTRIVLAGTARAEVDGTVLDEGTTISGRPAVRISAGPIDGGDEFAVLPLVRGIATAAAIGIGVSAVPAPEPVPGPGAVAEPTSEGPLVPSLVCPQGHANPPWARTCRLCGDTVPPQQLVPMPRPSPGELRLVGGEVIPLDGDVVLGRTPTSDAPARLVTLASNGNDISRNHAVVVLREWLVQVVDLGSTNGTVVTLPGQEPVQLRPHDPFAIVPGTVVAFSATVSLRYEAP